MESREASRRAINNPTFMLELIWWAPTQINIYEKTT